MTLASGQLGELVHARLQHGQAIAVAIHRPRPAQHAMRGHVPQVKVR